jgi:hypothetical protein
VADQRYREREGSPSLAMKGPGGEASIVSSNTRSVVANGVRKLLRDALESGTADRLGLDREFITAMPAAGGAPLRARRPFPDEVARALADEANLVKLAQLYDPEDRGLRDVWETIVITGRRVNEVLKVRWGCIGRYGGLAMFWHDQTKVGNYDAAIRIPERLYDILAERQRKTLGHFEPTARAIDGLEKALAGLGLLDDALALDLRKPQDYFHRVWSTAFLASDLARAGGHDAQYDSGDEAGSGDPAGERVNADTRSRGGPRTAAALAARRTSAEAALGRVHDALARMRREKTPVTVAAIARRAAVSRTFIYTNTDARTAVAGAATPSDTRQADDRAAQDAGREATWRERALNAEDALKAATAEIVRQRARIGEFLGQVRDLEAEWTRRPSSASPPRTPPSNSEYATRQRQPDPGRTTQGSPVEHAVPGPPRRRPRGPVRRSLCQDLTGRRAPDAPPPSGGGGASSSAG